MVEGKTKRRGLSSLVLIDKQQVLLPGLFFYSVRHPAQEHRIRIHSALLNMDSLGDVKQQRTHLEGPYHTAISEDAAASASESVPSDRRHTLRQRPPGLLIPPNGPSLDQNISPANPDGTGASFADLPSDGTTTGLGITLQDFSQTEVISSPTDRFRVGNSAGVSGATLAVGSARRESSISPTLSDLDVRRQLSDNTMCNSPFTMIGLSSPESTPNSVVGGDFDRSWGSFSFSGRGKTPPAMDTRSEPGPIVSSKSSSSSSEESSRSHRTNGASSSKRHRLKAKFDSLSMENLGLHQKTFKQDARFAQYQAESSAKSNLQSRRLKEHFRATLQAFNIIQPNNARPIWKQDTDGTRSGPLYDNVPSIYRESAVELLISRAAIQRMVKDYDAMVTTAFRALITAETLTFAPLIARCHFVHGIALYHTHHFTDALQEFQLSYGCGDEYGISNDFVEEWREKCIGAIDSPYDIPYETATKTFPRTDFTATHSGASATARKRWGVPTDGKSNTRDSQANAIRRRRASTVLQAQSLLGINDDDDDVDDDDDDDDDADDEDEDEDSNTGSSTTAGNYNDSTNDSSGEHYDLRRHPRTSIGTRNERLSRTAASIDTPASMFAPDYLYDPGVVGSRPRTSTAILFRESFQFHPKETTNSPAPEEETGNDPDPTAAGNRSRSTTETRFQDPFAPKTEANTSPTTSVTDNHDDTQIAEGRTRAETAVRDPGGYFVQANISSRAITTESRPRATSIMFPDLPGSDRSLSSFTYSPDRPGHARSKSLFTVTAGRGQTPSEVPIKPIHARSKSLFSGAAGREQTLNEVLTSTNHPDDPATSSTTQRKTVFGAARLGGKPFDDIFKSPYSIPRL